jgi:hypothetical protein
MQNISCPICNLKLSRPESIIAGIGPVCHKRLKFAEKATFDELRTMASKREFPKTFIKNNKILIAKNQKEEVYSLFKVLNSNKEEFIALNLNQVREEYDKEKNIVSAYLNSIHLIKYSSLEFVSDLQTPDHPDFRKKFNFFNEEYKNEMLEQNYIEKSFQELGISTYYVKINTKEDMTTYQRNNREEMSQIREKEPQKYSNMWSSGIFQRATLMHRLKSLKNKESNDFYNFLMNSEQSKLLDVKDWGLTDEEIINGLKHSTQKIESYLFMAFLNGNKNFTLMLALSKKIPEMSKNNKFKAYQVLIKMLGNPSFNLDDLKKEFK